MWTLSIFRLSGLISLLFGAEWGGVCSSGSQSLVKAIPICGTWESCLPGRTPLVFNWTEDYFLMFLQTFVEVCVRQFTNVIARRTVLETRIYPQHRYWWGASNLHWIPQKRLCKKKKGCLESSTTWYRPQLTSPWDKSKPGASSGCGLWMRILSSSPVSPVNMCIRVMYETKINLQ